MNEFIVWDEDEQQFLTTKEIFDDTELGFDINKDGKLSLINFGVDEIFNPDGDDYNQCFRREINIKTFNYIGKTDIEGNKIYADSSIVEFVYRNNNSRAVIKWDDIQLTYDVEFRSGFRARYADVYQEMFGLKVIGTLQENPELLKEDN